MFNGSVKGKYLCLGPAFREESTHLSLYTVGKILKPSKEAMMFFWHWGVYFNIEDVLG